MSSSAAHTQLDTVFREKGWVVGVIPAVHVAEIRRMLARARAAGVLDEEFYRIELDETFEWVPPPEFPAASVIAAVRPALPHRLVFVRSGEERVFLIPPTYVGYRRHGEEMRQLITGTLAPFCYRTSATRIPDKTLAVRGGLARYGKNNITYAPGLGSFAQIASALGRWPQPAPAGGSRAAAAFRMT
jgi:epoxyqueuosine reductase